MQEARAAGCHSSADADTYFEQKRKREAEESGRRKEGGQAGVNMDSMGTFSNLRNAAEQAISSSLTDLDIKADLLSEPVSTCAVFRYYPAAILWLFTFV